MGTTANSRFLRDVKNEKYDDVCYVTMDPEWIQEVLTQAICDKWPGLKGRSFKPVSKIRKIIFIMTDRTPGCRQPKGKKK